MADGVQFDRQSAQRIANVVRRVENTSPGAAPVGPRQHPIITEDKFLAKITDSASLADSRFKYAWIESLMDGDLVANRVDGRSGTTGTNYAVNLAEMYHTAIFAWGVDLSGTDYPAGFGARPIGGAGDDDTHKYDVVVEMTQLIDKNGDKKYYFTLMGSHDGVC